VPFKPKLYYHLAPPLERPAEADPEIDIQYFQRQQRALQDRIAEASSSGAASSSSGAASSSAAVASSSAAVASSSAAVATPKTEPKPKAKRRTQAQIAEQEARAYVRRGPRGQELEDMPKTRSGRR
jgi:Mg-chelatase subunit ChlI